MLLFLLGIIVFPLAHAVITSLYREAGVTVRFVGAQNYTRLLDDAAFWNSLRVSVVFTAASVGLHLVIAMPVALFLNQLRRGRTTLRLAFLTPWMVTPVIGAIAWVWLLDPHFGVVNHLLRSVGLIAANQVWLGEPGLALGSIIAVIGDAATFVTFCKSNSRGCNGLWGRRSSFSSVQRPDVTRHASRPGHQKLPRHQHPQDNVPQERPPGRNNNCDNCATNPA